jgi:hypothetical protein
MPRTETAKAQVRQTSDRWLLHTVIPAAGGAFPGELNTDAAGAAVAPVRNVQSRVRRARGYSVVRVGVTSTITGTLRVMQGWVVNRNTGPTNFATVFSAPTIADPVSGLFVLDADVVITREFAMIRFNGGADLAGTFEIGAFLLPLR